MKAALQLEKYGELDKYNKYSFVAVNNIPQSLFEIHQRCLQTSVVLSKRVAHYDPH
jgi:hypothetical protein